MTRSQLLIFSGIGVVVILAVLVFTGVLPGLRSKAQPPPQPVALTFWGVFDRPEVYGSLVASYRAIAPHVTITYVQRPALTYEQDLLNAFAAGKGPDIFMLHNRWLPRWQDKLSPAPENNFTPQNFEQTFADVASFDLVRDGKIWAAPFSLDTLALFYNRDLFNQARLVEPPKTWEEFSETVKTITVRDETDAITRAGAALGTSENVNRASDIIALLMLQSGSSITDPKTGQALFSGAVGERALQFYTDFANPDRPVYTWNRRQHNSLDAFIEGRAAMMLNYNYQIPVIKNRAPQLRFAVVPTPQFKNRDRDTALASYWSYTVSKASKEPGTAWHFLASSVKPRALRPFLQANNRPSARRDLLAEQFSDPVVGPFANQALVAKSFVAVDNLLVEKTFDDMIELVVKEEKTIRRAVEEAAGKINAGLRP